jgi:hypothetical protein
VKRKKEMNIVRLSLISVAAAAAIALLPIRALADQPNVRYETVSTSVLIPAHTGLCSFDLNFTGTGTVKVTTYVDHNGVPVRQLVDGALTHSLTSAWASISTNGPAPVHVDLSTGNSVDTGNEFHFTLAGAGVVLAGAGRLVLDAQNVEISYSGLNVPADRVGALCAALGP